MRERLSSFPQLRIFCQNVNRNYGYMDTLLAGLYEEYDLLLIQEPPWAFVRNAPSSSDREGERVVGPPINPNWGCVVRPSGLDSPPRVATYFNVRISSLRPRYRRDLIDHRDVLVLSLGLGEGCALYVNVYSDDNHTAISALHEGLQAWPNVHLLCGDMNVRHSDWDPLGPDRNIHAERLVASTERLGLGLCLPAEPGPTPFPFNRDLSPTVIDLMFVREDLSLVYQHTIVPEGRGPSDHAPLVISIPAPDSLVPVTRWLLPRDSDAEFDYLVEVRSALAPLLAWRGTTPQELEEITSAISSIFSKAWDSHAKEFRLGRHSKGWWTQDCTDALAIFHVSHMKEDWSAYRSTMRAAKRNFFELKIHEIASSNRRPWDLVAWTRKRNLPTYEAISYGGVPCTDLESLWSALDGSYNAANDRAVDLTYLEAFPPIPQRDWVPFSVLEMREALKACASHSAPGPDHVTWSYLKFWCLNLEVAGLITRIAEACITTGHWPEHFKESLSVIIPKPGKPAYSTPKAFRPIVLLNTLGKLVEKMLARRLQFDGVAHGAFQPNQFGGVAQRSMEDAGVYLTHLIRAGWAKGLQTSVVAFDIAQFFPSLNHSVLLDIILRSGFFFFFLGHQFLTRGSNAVRG